MGIINAWDEVTANCNDMPGPGTDGGHELRVTVSGSFTRGGCAIELVYHEPQGINPGDLMLDVVLTPSENGPDVITPFEASYPADGTADSAKYESVSFRVVGTDDEPPPTTVVDHLG